MLTVSDLMTRNPLSVRTDTSLRCVVQLMQRENIRQLPVMENGRLIGIITDRDVRNVLGSVPVDQSDPRHESLLDTTSAASCMTSNPVTVTPETPAYRAAEMLSLFKFGSLIVVNESAVVGIITVTDFLTAFAGNRKDEVWETRRTAVSLANR